MELLISLFLVLPTYTETLQEKRTFLILILIYFYLIFLYFAVACFASRDVREIDFRSVDVVAQVAADAACGLFSASCFTSHDR